MATVGSYSEIFPLLLLQTMMSRNLAFDDDDEVSTERQSFNGMAKTNSDGGEMLASKVQ